jgi:uncharacterized iron-regulated membrane protein
MAVFKKPDAGFFRQMLSGHSVMGLTAAFLMYVICVSGTLAVFYKEFWRWEQPVATVETMAVNGERIDLAVRRALADYRETHTGDQPDFIGIDMPTSDWPRMAISYGEQRRYVEPDGSLAAAVDRPWSFFMARLHFALNLPLELGVVIVGIFGVLLTALIVSGFLAHPGIIRDAFALRLNRSRQLQQTDLHNRLSVWAAPFHLLIAVTGAILGLAGMISLASSLLPTDEPVTPDQAPAAVSAEMSASQAGLPDFNRIWQDFGEREPDNEVFYLSIYEPGSVGQEVEISAIEPDRLYWSQGHRYSGDGEYLRATGGEAASVGGKMQSSLYRLHFGHFGGMPIKIAFFLLGAALCVICATGVNIWLAKRRQRKQDVDAIDRMWQVSVWGTLALLPLSVVLHLTLGVPPVPVFWGGLAALAAMAWRLSTPARWAFELTRLGWVSALAVPMIHTMLYGMPAWQGGSLTVNAVWLALAGGLLIRQWKVAVPPVIPAAV